MNPPGLSWLLLVYWLLDKLELEHETRLAVQGNKNLILLNLNINLMNFICAQCTLSTVVSLC